LEQDSAMWTGEPGIGCPGLQGFCDDEERPELATAWMPSGASCSIRVGGPGAARLLFPVLPGSDLRRALR
jgi:hypothetical protein